MPLFPRGHNSLTVLSRTGHSADGKPLYTRVPNPNLTAEERSTLLANLKSIKKKPEVKTPPPIPPKPVNHKPPIPPKPSPVKKSPSEKSAERYDKLLAAAGRERKRPYKPRA